MQEIELNDLNFEAAVLRDTGVVLVDFWAPWCIPCKKLAPVIKEIAQSFAGRIKVCTVNTDVAPAVAAQFQIASIPTLILFKGGKPYEKIIGFHAKADIEKKILQTLS
jgi:thioredoxin 1